MAQENFELTGSTQEEPARIKPAEVFLAETALLRKVAAGLGLRAGDIDDVLQTVSAKCLNHAGTFANRAQCRRWLIRVTTNECITEHRHTRRFRRHAVDIVARRPRAVVTGPVQSAVSAEQIEAVQRALDDLDDALLRPLVLRYFGDLSSAEIGAILEMPASTVRAALRQGRLALAKVLIKRGIGR